MFYCPYYNYYDSLYREEAAPVSYVRVLHAAPGAPPVDIYVNNNLIVRRLPYKGFSVYVPVNYGNYNIKVFPAGTTQNPVINTNLEIPASSIFTIAAIGTLPNLSLQPILEPIIPTIPEKVYIRFVHLSPNAPNVNLTLSDGTVLFRDVQYKEVTDYIPVDAGTYSFDLRLTSSDERVLYVPNQRLRANRFYTIYAVGLAGKTPPLQALLPLDGNTYLKV
jgi:hypothetical protein